MYVRVGRAGCKSHVHNTVDGIVILFEGRRIDEKGRDEENAIRASKVWVASELGGPAVNNRLLAECTTFARKS